MANRTIQLFGQGYGSAPAAMTVNCNGIEVFSGTVPTLDEPAPVMIPNMNRSTDRVLLCSFEMPMSVEGLVPMTVEVTSGAILLADVMANYQMIFNPVFNETQLTQLGNPATTDSEKMAIYNAVANPAFSASEKTILVDVSVMDTEKDAILAAHNCGLMVSTGATCRLTQFEPRHNVTIDGVPQTPDTTGFTGGTWWWMVRENSTMSCNFMIPSAT